MPIPLPTSTTGQAKLIPGKFYIYGSNPEQYFLVHKFLGLDSLGRIVMQTKAGPAEIVGEGLDFIGPFDTQQQGIDTGYQMYPNASKHYAEPQIYYESSYQPYQYQYYPFYTYYYPYWPLISRRFGPWRRRGGHWGQHWGGGWRGRGR